MDQKQDPCRVENQVKYDRLQVVQEMGRDVRYSFEDRYFKYLSVFQMACALQFCPSFARRIGPPLTFTVQTSLCFSRS